MPEQVGDHNSSSGPAKLTRILAGHGRIPVSLAVDLKAISRSTARFSLAAQAQFDIAGENASVRQPDAAYRLLF